ncbi:MAG: AAA family ATPase [Shimia sp.]|nr:AAA family ATPase [Shimia sp.]
MDICLEEIRRCQAATPHPNFIVLMGDRYGWCPLPAEIEASAFLTIANSVGKTEKRKLLEDWYRRDDNAIPPVYCLQERRGQFEDTPTWENQVEKPLGNVLVEAVNGRNLEDGVKRLFDSAVEQEVFAGILDVPSAKQHALCFLRNLLKAPTEVETSRFVERTPLRRSRLDKLKNRLRQALGENVREYSVGWEDGRPSHSHLEALCNDVLASLWHLISGEIEARQNQDPLEVEIADHAQFGADRSREFVGREDILTAVSQRLAEGHQVLAIHGESGCGKSALMGEIAKRIHQTWYPGAILVERYVGATAESIDIRKLLNGICRQITREEKIAGDADYQQLVKDLRSALQSAGPENPLVVMIDALDQLAPFEHARELAWLPVSLPPHVYIVVSTTPGETLTASQDKLTKTALLRLEGMPSVESELLLERWLAGVDRKLTPSQKEVVCKSFRRCNMPLYFHLVFQEVRGWRSYRPPEETKLKPNIPGIIHDVLDRLSRDDQHGRLIVSRSLAYLDAARSGLTEDELLDVLSADDEVIDDLEKRSFHKLPQRRLPVVIWSRLFFELEHYLSQRSADGTRVLSFFHRQLADVVGKRFLHSGEVASRSAHLARYFASRRLEWRGVSEYPFAQAQAGLTKDLERTLTDFEFIEAKIGFSGCQAMIDEYDLLKTEAGNGSVAWRRTVQQALRQSAAVVAVEPSLLPGQLLGRLQACAARPVKALLEQARSWRGRTWLCPLLPSLTAFGPLMRTLTHEGNIAAIALTRDGRRLVSASSDRTVRIWEARTGAELHRLEHSRAVVAVAISPDQKRIISYGGGSIRCWDIATGAELDRLTRPRMPTTYYLAVSKDGKHVTTITASGIRVWEVATGQTEDIRVQSMRWAALSADGRRVVIAQASQVKYYDLDTGDQRRLKVTEGVDRVTISADGSRVVVSSSTGWFYDWDIEDLNAAPAAINVGLRAYSLATSFDGSACLAILGNGTLSLSDLDSQRVIADCEVPDARMALVPDDGKFAFTVVGRRSVQLWRLEPRTSEPASLPHRSAVTAVAISADGRLALSASTAGDILVWDVHQARDLYSLQLHQGKVNALAFDPSGTRFVSAGADKRLLVWDNPDDRPKAFRLGAAGVLCTALTAEGVALAVGRTRKGDLRLWRFGHTGDEQRLEAHGKSVRDAAISPDGKYLASSGGDRSVCRWELVGAGSRTAYVEKKGVVRHIAISADGRRTICGLGRSLCIADPIAGEVSAVLRGHTEPVQDAALNATGQRAVSVGRDGHLFLWDTENGTPIAGFRADTSFTSCHISPDGGTIVAGDNLGGVHLLRVRLVQGDK